MLYKAGFLLAVFKLDFLTRSPFGNKTPFFGQQIFVDVSLQRQRMRDAERIERVASTR